ncbi:prepilin peptidase [[Empedobacter] haloabium]|uniref:Prepilin peptidase n=1 Tax=[Empedobacter] haloabium TaxID=592317 RepID=A0ABZ1UJT9_9BURK
MNPALQILLLWLVMQAAVTDLAIRRIPNVLVLSGLALAAALHWYAGAGSALLSTWLAGCATGFFLFIPLYALRGMAAGDVKLMAMVGAFAGPLLALQIVLLTCLIGGVLGLLIVLHSGRWRILGRNLAAILAPLIQALSGVPQQHVPLPRVASAGGIPYGVAIALGTLCALGRMNY